MTLNTNLGKNSIVAFVTIVDVDKARTFYRDTLGLTLVREDLPFALVFDANGIMLRVSISKQRVAFERYGFLEQDAQGIWNSPTGAKVAWFKDPDENLLSLTEFAAD
jgi:catechol 2,3-dioxygenase-like lactoylglutathione lyase family enzyme